MASGRTTHSSLTVLFGRRRYDTHCPSLDQCGSSAGDESGTARAARRTVEDPQLVVGDPRRAGRRRSGLRRAGGGAGSGDPGAAPAGGSNVRPRRDPRHDDRHRRQGAQAGPAPAVVVAGAHLDRFPAVRRRLGPGGELGQARLEAGGGGHSSMTLRSSASAPMAERLDRSRAAPEGAGDLGFGHPGVVAQDDRSSLAKRQPGEGVAQLVDVVMAHTIGRPGVAALDEDPAVAVAAPVDDGGAQVGRRIVHPIDPVADLDERLLDDLFGLRGRAGQEERHPDHVGVAAAVERDEVGGPDHSRYRPGHNHRHRSRRRSARSGDGQFSLHSHRGDDPWGCGVVPELVAFGQFCDRRLAAISVKLAIELSISTRIWASRSATAGWPSPARVAAASP